jgi:hypothetical protein
LHFIPAFIDLLLQRSRACVMKSRKKSNGTVKIDGQGSSVGIATDYRLDGTGIESQWGRDFLHLSRPALGPTQPPTLWVLGQSWGVKLPGCGITHPHLAHRLKKEHSYISIPPLWLHGRL